MHEHVVHPRDGFADRALHAATEDVGILERHPPVGLHVEGDAIIESRLPDVELLDGANPDDPERGIAAAAIASALP